MVILHYQNVDAIKKFLQLGKRLKLIDTLVRTSSYSNIQGEEQELIFSRSSLFHHFQHQHTPQSENPSLAIPM